VELYEAGILKDKDMPGFPADSGKRFYYLMERWWLAGRHR
jgi:aldehyde:ferredoxin oxidoreductase